MKNTLLLITVIILFSCHTQKKSEILYFLPFTVQQKLSEKLKTINDKDISFALGHDNMGNFIIYLDHFKKNEHQFWIKNTNRVVFINERFYPIVFESDEFFSYPEEKKSILEKMNEEKVITKIMIIRENSFYIKFSLDGKIIKDDR